MEWKLPHEELRRLLFSEMSDLEQSKGVKKERVRRKRVNTEYLNVRTKKLDLFICEDTTSSLKRVESSATQE